MPNEPIGWWVLRVSADGHRAHGVPHLVESLIADEPVTRCGRRLETQERSVFLYQQVPALRPCQVCFR